MIKQATGRCDEQVDAFGELIRLGFAVRAAHDDRVRMTVPVFGGQDLARDAKDLQRELACRRDDDRASACVRVSAGGCEPSALPMGNRRRTSCLCSANAPFRGLKRSRDSISIAGSRNASVLPEPVRAAPSKSRPASSGGIARAWISVMRSKPRASIALRVDGEKSMADQAVLSSATGVCAVDPPARASSAAADEVLATGAASSPSSSVGAVLITRAAAALALRSRSCARRRSMSSSSSGSRLSTAGTGGSGAGAVFGRLRFEGAGAAAVEATGASATAGALARLCVRLRFLASGASILLVIRRLATPDFHRQNLPHLLCTLGCKRINAPCGLCSD